MRGADLKDQESTDSQACPAVSQIILFNCKKKAAGKKKPSNAKSKHSLQYEPPLPVYLGLNIHAPTRSKNTQLYKLGLNASYDQVLQVESDMATAIYEKVTEKSVVGSLQLRQKSSQWGP